MCKQGAEGKKCKKTNNKIICLHTTISTTMINANGTSTSIQKQRF